MPASYGGEHFRIGFIAIAQQRDAIAVLRGAAGDVPRRRDRAARNGRRAWRCPKPPAEADGGACVAQRVGSAPHPVDAENAVENAADEGESQARPIQPMEAATSRLFSSACTVTQSAEAAPRKPNTTVIVFSDRANNPSISEAFEAGGLKPVAEARSNPTAPAPARPYARMRRRKRKEPLAGAGIDEIFQQFLASRARFGLDPTQID